MRCPVPECGCAGLASPARRPASVCGPCDGSWIQRRGHSSRQPRSQSQYLGNRFDNKALLPVRSARPSGPTRSRSDAHSAGGVREIEMTTCACRPPAPTITTVVGYSSGSWERQA
eukprot:2290645-Prymnesium_polylepis.1